MKKDGKASTIIIVIVIILVLAGGVAFFLLKDKEGSSPNTEVKEAKKLTLNDLYGLWGRCTGDGVYTYVVEKNGADSTVKMGFHKGDMLGGKILSFDNENDIHQVFFQALDDNGTEVGSIGINISTLEGDSSVLVIDGNQYKIMSEKDITECNNQNITTTHSENNTNE